MYQPDPNDFDVKRLEQIEADYRSLVIDCPEAASALRRRCLDPVALIPSEYVKLLKERKLVLPFKGQEIHPDVCRLIPKINALSDDSLNVTDDNVPAETMPDQSREIEAALTASTSSDQVSHSEEQGDTVQLVEDPKRPSNKTIQDLIARRIITGFY